MICLSDRLMAIADMAPRGSKLADVGTDHGRLPVYLLQRGISEYVIAADISEKPLQRAKENASYWEIGGRLDFLLTDGLKGIEASSVDTIVIAGMGGVTIAEIIEAAPWVPEGKHRLILQPMSSVEKLRRRLYQLGLEIFRETLVLEEGVIYTVILSGGAAAVKNFEPWEEYVSRGLMESSAPLLDEYLQRMTAKLKKAVSGAKRSSKSIDAGRAEHFRLALQGLEKEMTERGMAV